MSLLSLPLWSLSLLSLSTSSLMRSRLSFACSYALISSILAPLPSSLLLLCSSLFYLFQLFLFFLLFCFTPPFLLLLVFFFFVSFTVLFYFVSSFRFSSVPCSIFFHPLKPSSLVLVPILSVQLHLLFACFFYILSI